MIMQTKKEIIENAKEALKQANWQMFVYWLACIRETYQIKTPYDLKSKLIELGILKESCQTHSGAGCVVCIKMAKEDEFLKNFELYSVKFLKEDGKWFRYCEVIHECIIKAFGVFPIHV